MNRISIRVCMCERVYVHEHAVDKRNSFRAFCKPAASHLSHTHVRKGFIKFYIKKNTFDCKCWIFVSLLWALWDLSTHAMDIRSITRKYIALPLRLKIVSPDWIFIIFCYKLCVEQHKNSMKWLLNQIESAKQCNATFVERTRMMGNIFFSLLLSSLFLI